jgi:hypothetical protein
MTLLVLALAALCYCLWWIYAARTARAGLDDWVARRRAAGVEVALSDVETTGFPLAIRMSARNVAIRQPGGPGWAAPGLVPGRGRGGFRGFMSRFRGLRR